MCFMFLVGVTIWGQYLEVHHIKVNNGDSEIIAFKDAEGIYKLKALIDGGDTASDDFLIPYLKKNFGQTGPFYFDYVILTHYHHDHYHGLQDALKKGAVRTENYIDPGGYSLDCGHCDLEPKNSNRGVSIGGNLGAYLKAIKTAAEKNYLKRYQPMNKEMRSEQESINTLLNLGSYGGVDIQLRCVALWENTLDANGDIKNDDSEGKKTCRSSNNISIAFVLECGEFRYYLGGDLGGSYESDYINQETTLSKGLRYLYKASKPFDHSDRNTYEGHICGIKIDHHGSAYSNNDDFLSSVRPAICVTSVGDRENWHLPDIDVITRLDNSSTLTHEVNSGGTGPVFLQGFYFTNLQNFVYNGKTYNNQSKADQLYSHRENTDYANNFIGYIVSVKVDSSVKTESKFDVYKISEDLAGKYEKVISGSYFCHKR
jgi:hypothetical protein